MKQIGKAISKGVKQIKTNLQAKATKGIVKFVGNTPAGAKLKAGLIKQGKKY